MLNFIKKHWHSLKLAILASVLVGSFAAFGDIAFAQLEVPHSDVITSIPTQEPIGALILRLVNYFTGFLGFIAGLAFLYAGVLWIVSGGNEESISKAKKIMTYAALGLVVVILSFSIVQFVTRSIGESGPRSDLDECVQDNECDPGEQCLFTEFDDGQDRYTCRTIDRFTCRDDLDCPVGFACENDACVPSDRPGIEGSPAEPAFNDDLDAIDNLLDGMEDDLDISNLPQELQNDVESAISSDLSQSVENIQNLIDTNVLTPAERSELESLINGLDRLQLLEDELRALDESRPESLEINAAFEKVDGELKDLINDPTNTTLFRRFERDYRTLVELIRAFPVMQARIRAFPAEGNVPFQVQLDGLDSIDPTGGTISDYKWTFLDASGTKVSLGNEPVVLYEFTEPNTYSIRLQVNTSQLEGGFPTATDGVSVVRVKANPPAADVRFRINGKEVFDIYHVTLKEAQAGLAFDPSLTTPALGRTITKYEWFYGDTQTETRQQPTTVVHSYGEPGEYFVQLVTTDSLGIQDRRVVKVFVKSLAAEINVRPKTGNVNTEFQFVGVRSRSDDGRILDYEWEVLDEQGRKVADSTDETFFYQFDAPGTYKINLLVTDITGSSDRIVQELDVDSRPPVAAFNFEIPESNHPNRVLFNAVDSYDPDRGDSITYSWDFDGDGEFDVIDSEENNITHDYNKVGDQRVALQVQDEFGERTQVQKVVPVDSILSADINVDRLATRVGEPITFEADSPNAVAYLWEFGDGQTASTDEPTVEHTYDSAGKFTVRLNFFDEDDNDNTDTIRMLVGPGEQPLAKIDYTVNGREARLVNDLCGDDEEGAVVTRADTIRFDAKNSINTDGSSRLLNYDWQFPNGEKSSNREASYKFDEISGEGECFEVSLVVRDELTGKLSLEDTAQFKVINQLPEIIDFVIESPDDQLVTPAKVRLRVIAPKDQDGTIKKYKWWYAREGFEDDRLGLHNTADPETEMIITSFGEPDILNRYFFTVEIVDNDNGVYSSTERFGEVSYLDVQNGPNLSPVAEFTVDKTTISVGDSISFVSKSYDPQGDNLPNDAFRWDFDGDGQFDDTSSGPQVNRQYNTPGEYEVRLRVVNRGLSSSATKTIFVEPTNALPQAAFTFEVEDNTVTFDGGHSRFDPDIPDTTLRFEWDFDISDDANGNGINDDDVQSTEIDPSFTYDEKGLYRVRLKVKDVLGMEGVVVRDVDLNLTEAQRQSAAFQSLKVSTPKHALTSLDVSVIPARLNVGDSADINALVLNADGSPYEGQIFFDILEGSGNFTPNPVEAKDSRATAIFTATDSGTVRIRIRATETIHGELSEEAFIDVR